MIVAVDVLGFTIILPLLPFYAEQFGASPFVVGVLATSFAFCQFLSGPWLGRLSDRFGRKPVLMVSQTGTLIGFLVLAVANSLPLVFLSRIIDGVTAGNLSIAQAAIADVTAPEKRARAFGIIGIAFGLGFLIGPGIAGLLSKIDLHAPAYFAAGLSALSIFLTWRFLPAPPTRANSELLAKGLGSLRHAFSRPALRLLLAEFFVFGLQFAGFTSGFALFASRRFTWDGHPVGPAEVSWLFTYMGFLGLILQGFLLGPLVKRFGEARLVWAGFATSVVSYTMLAFVTDLPGLLIAMTIGAFGSGVLRPALTALVSQAADPHEQGTVLGATQSLVSLGQILAPLISGWIIGLGDSSPGLLAWWGGWMAILSLIGVLMRSTALGPAPHEKPSSSPPANSR